jgi:RyR domain/ATPase family associated with various cellular activities (AAA)
MACNPALSALANARHLVLRLGLEGAVYYSSTPQGIVSRLYFDPSQVEGGYAARYPGGMQGLGDAFAAGLAQALVCPAPSATADETPARVAAGIRAGLRAARRLLQGGFGQAAGISAFPTPAVFAHGLEPEAAPLAEVVVPNPVATEPPDPAYWCILKDMPGTVLEDLAHDLVRHGLTEGLLSVPVGEFGKLRTADRVEIEGLRSLRNLIDEYLNGTPARPLSVAVFGAPGSGKSFAVTQVAESIGGSQRVERVEFNVSQFRSPDDLVQAFHRVRDIALTGAVPLVFFDEFDSGYESELGWLKYFLAPMQDGVFRDGEAVHPIGKAIFVFAGGTHSSFREFAEPELECGPEASSAAREAALRRFKAVKGPDFVSRLRGFVDILGPNPVAESDTTAVVRRAMLLRSLIERKARRLLDSHGGARIDEGVLRALLRVPAYRHGARSMEALLDMSMLAGRSCWEQAALPPAIQLALHVDSDIFTRLMLRDVLLTAARDVLGQAVHENYRHNQEGKKSPDDPSMQPWEKLREDFRESNRQQADHIAAKLRRIGCGPRPISGCEPAPFTFTEKEVEIMAEMEHERWVVERRIADWVYGPKRDPDHKVSPYLVPYSKLPDDVKGWDRDAVRAIPEILALARFEVYRLF